MLCDGYDKWLSVTQLFNACAKLQNYKLLGRKKLYKNHGLSSMSVCFFKDKGCC